MSLSDSYDWTRTSVYELPTYPRWDQVELSSIVQCHHRLRPTSSILHRTFDVTDLAFTIKVSRNYKDLVKLQKVTCNTCEGDGNSSCEALRLHPSSRDNKRSDG